MRIAGLKHFVLIFDLISLYVIILRAVLFVHAPIQQISPVRYLTAVPITIRGPLDLTITP